MTERVILGNRGSDTGIWVSVPGKSALSTTYEDLMIDSTRTNLQPLLSGIISKPTLSFTGGSANSGTATYLKDFFYKSDRSSLGFIPICHFSIGSDIAGEIYPTIQIDATKVRLLHQEVWQNNSRKAWSKNLGPSIGWYEYDLWTDPGKPGSISYSCDIHYTIYAQASGLT